MLDRHVGTLILLAAVACGGGNTAGSAAKTPTRSAESGPWLWEVSKDGKASYVFGLPSDGVMAAEVPALVWDKLEASKRLCVGSSPDQEFSDDELERLRMLPDGRTLDTLLTPGEWDKVRFELEPWLVAEVLPRLRLWMISTWMTTPEIPATDVEAKLVERHRGVGKPLVVAGDDSVLMEFMLDDQRLLPSFRVLLHDLDEGRARSYKESELYRSGDLAAYLEHRHGELVRDPMSEEAYRALVETVKDRAIRELEKGGAFCALGLYTLVGPGRLLELVEKRGFRVRRLGAGTPPVLPGKATEFVTRADCRAVLDRAVELIALDAAAKGRPMSPAAREARRRQSQSPKTVHGCLSADTPRSIRCYKAAKSIKEFGACGEQK